MNREALIALAAIAAGFAAGFLWGARTREALPGATDWRFADGKLLITVDAKRAADEGLAAMLRL